MQRPCYGMRLAPTPATRIETILDLKRLLAEATSQSHDVNIDSGAARPNQQETDVVDIGDSASP
jgi:hypothetical protein